VCGPGLEGGAQDAAGIARRNDTRGNIPGHDAAGADGRAVADGDAAQDECAGADPAVPADGDRLVDRETADAFALLVDPGALRGMHGVAGGEELHARRDHTAIADGDVGTVEEDAVKIDEHRRAYMDVLAVFPVDRRHHDGPSEAAEQLA